MNDDNIPQGCKPFDLEAALRGEPVVTRDGRKVLQIAYFPEAKNSMSKVVYLIENFDVLLLCNIKGSRFSDLSHNADLFMDKLTRTYWINVYRRLTDNEIFTLHKTYKSEEEAKQDSRSSYECNSHYQYLKSIPVEIDEAPQKPKTKKLWIGISKFIDVKTYIATDAYLEKHELEKELRECGTLLDFDIKEIEVEV